jgi:hypothetical protein
MNHVALHAQTPDNSLFLQVAVSEFETARASFPQQEARQALAKHHRKRTANYTQGFCVAWTSERKATSKRRSQRRPLQMLWRSPSMRLVQKAQGLRIPPSTERLPQ